MKTKTNTKSEGGNAAPDNTADIVGKAGDAMLETIAEQEKYILSLVPDTLSDIQALKLQLFANTCATTMMKLERNVGILHREVSK